MGETWGRFILSCEPVKSSYVLLNYSGGSGTDWYSHRHKRKYERQQILSKSRTLRCENNLWFYVLLSSPTKTQVPPSGLKSSLPQLCSAGMGPGRIQVAPPPQPWRSIPSALLIQQHTPQLSWVGCCPEPVAFLGWNHRLVGLWFWGLGDDPAPRLSLHCPSGVLSGSSTPTLFCCLGGTPVARSSSILPNLGWGGHVHPPSPGSCTLRTSREGMQHQLCCPCPPERWLPCPVLRCRPRRNPSLGREHGMRGDTLTAMDEKKSMST